MHAANGAQWLAIGPNRRTSRAVNIALMGPFGMGNLGDATIQDAVIHNIRRLYPASRIYGISLNPADTEERHGIPTFAMDASIRSRVGPTWFDRFLATGYRSVLARLVQKTSSWLVRTVSEAVFLARACVFTRRLDVLVVSGGGQIDDFWGGPWKQPLSMFKWSLLAKLCRCRLVILSIGGWNLRSSVSRWLVRYALSLADYRSYRDDRTKDFVKSLGVEEHNHVFPDLAFSYPRRAYTNGQVKRTETLVIGISPIAADAWTTTEAPEYRAYCSALQAFAMDLLRAGHTVHLFPSQVKMDLPVVAELRRHLERNCDSEIHGRIIEIPIQTVGDFMSAVEQVDIIIASRLHGVLLSALANKPVLAIAYQSKVRELMTQLTMQEHCLDLRDATEQNLKIRFAALKDFRDAIECRMGVMVRRFRASLDRQFRQVFSDGNSGKASRRLNYPQ